MQFIRSTPEEASAALEQRLIQELSAGRKLLWLVSGGSNIALTVSIMGHMTDELSRHLSVMPVDERYGPPGHADSNWQQLMDAGFNAKQARLLPALKSGLDFAANTSYYNDLSTKAFAQHQVVIVQLGMGPDGHVSGILPHSPACQASSMVTGYDAPPLQRMTSTIAALRKTDAAYLFAYGDNKREQLLALKSQDLPLDEQPAQILKELAEAYVYNDQVED